MAPLSSPMRSPEMLAQAVLLTKPFVARALTGFDPSMATRQAPGLPNHAAWCLGHLSLTMHRVAGMIDGGDLPAADFIPGAARGDAERFGTESVAFKSEPTDDPAAFPTLARAAAIYDAACDRLAAAARGASEEALAADVPWGQAKAPLWTLVLRMAFHNGVHIGQMMDLRRALGLPRVVG
jgi:hypothetical protein